VASLLDETSSVDSSGDDIIDLLAESTNGR
jgi:hypothetical protein